MELTPRQIEVLRALRDDNRLVIKDGALGHDNSMWVNLAHATFGPLIHFGLVKNVGSIQYKSYTISPSGLRELKKRGEK